MIAPEALTGGFSDPVFQSQAVFRKLLDAFARPGTVVPIPAVVAPPEPLHLPTAAFICAFADEGTPVYIDCDLAQAGTAVDWIRFHTGAPVGDAPAAAAFAILTNPLDTACLGAFPEGSAEYPDRSTTILLQVDNFAGEMSLRLTGPGIDGSARVNPWPLPADFVDGMRRNHSLFPRGVDVILASPLAVVALPRSTSISLLQEE